jgi:hypothetical protein
MLHMSITVLKSFKCVVIWTINVKTIPVLAISDLYSLGTFFPVTYDKTQRDV